MVYAKARSPRLGQPTSVESAYVRMFSGDEIPESAWEGQLIYRNETQGLQIFNGNAWEDVVGGVAGLLTFVGPTPPVAQNEGDIWFNSADGNRMYRAAAAGADSIGAGEWEDMTAVAAVGAVIFWQDTPPTTANEGDLWYETDNGNKPYIRHLGAWVSVRDTTIATAQSTADSAASSAAAAQSAASSAQSSASTAIANAATAQATADGKVRSFFQDNPPTGLVAGDVGDMWFDTNDGNKMYQWTGSAWSLAQDQGIVTAINNAAAANTAAGNAAALANTKIVTFYQTSPPTALATGDLWVDTDDGNKLYRWSGSAWVNVQDSAIAAAAASATAANTAAANAMSAATAAQATADGAVSTYYQANPPWTNGTTGKANNFGDMWYDTDDGNTYRWNDTTKTWDPIEDSSIGAALGAAQNAQTTADGKITAWYSTGFPWANGLTTHDLDFGDIWFDTDDNNKPYYWAASRNWLSVRDGTIAIAQAAADDKIKAYYSTTPPWSNGTSGHALDDGDTWQDLSDLYKRLYRWVESTKLWTLITSDGLVPSINPVPRVTGGIGFLSVIWTAVVNQSTVSYDVHLSIAGPTFTPDSTTLMGDTKACSMTVRVMPDNTPLTYYVNNDPAQGVQTYYVRVIAKDMDGPQPTLAAAGSATLVQVADQDISADTVWAGTISADKITSGTLTADILMTGTIKTAETGQRVEISSADGLVNYGPDNVPRVILPTGGTDPAVLRGVAEVDSLTVKGDATFQGTTNISTGKDLNLNTGVSPPPVAPSISAVYEQIESDDPIAAGGTGSKSGFVSISGNYFHRLIYKTNGNWAIQQMATTNGAVLSTTNIGVKTLAWDRINFHGTPTNWWYVLRVANAPNAMWQIFQQNSLFAMTGVNFTHALDKNVNNFPAIFTRTDTTLGSVVTVAQVNASGALKFYNFNPTTGAFLSSATVSGMTFAVDTDLGTACTGTFDFTGGVSRVLIPIRGGDYAHCLAFDPANCNPDTDRGFPLAGFAAGIGWGNTNAELVSADTAGLMWERYGNIQRETSGMYYSMGAASTYYDSVSGKETTPGPTRTLSNTPKRAKVRVAIAGLAPGADSVRFHYTPLTALVPFATQPGVGALTALYTSLATSGTTPTSSTFLTGLPARVLAGTSVLLEGNKYGTFGTGDLKMTAIPCAGGGTVIEDGGQWLLCDGSAVDRTLFANLWDKLRAGTSSSPYGNGNGTTTFNLPDMRSRFPLGAGTWRSLGAGDAQAEASRTTSHTHDINAAGDHSHGVNGTSGTVNHTGLGNTATGGTADRVNAIAGSNQGTHAHGAGSYATGTTGDHTHGGTQGANGPVAFPHQAVNFLIKI